MRAHLVALAALLATPVAVAAPTSPGAVAMSLYDLQTHTLEGQPASLAAYQGKVALVVNVASKCGYTPQYEGLETLYEDYAARGLVVLGFPSNEFGFQEPGSAEQIRSFCSLTYGVTFPMFEKSVTKPGKDQSDVYRFLTDGRDAPSWNFAKYLVGKDGKVVRFFGSKVTPQDAELRAAIDAELAK